MKKNFTNMGTFGDTIFYLCLVKMLGGGNLYIKLNALDNFAKTVLGWPNAGPASGRYTQQDYDLLEPLLKAQDYLDHVSVWNGETDDYPNLIEHWKFHVGEKWQGNQTECYALALGMDIHDPAIKSKLLYEPWLTPVEPLKVPNRTIAIHRADRYNYNGPPSEQWNEFMDQNISENGFFLGTANEHAAFEDRFKIKIHHQKVNDLLEMARYIQGCELFIGNQSVHNSIAIGLGKTYWVELRKDYEHTKTQHGYGDNWFPRPNGYYF